MEKTITKVSDSLYNQFITDFELKSSIWSSTEPEQLVLTRQNAFGHFKKLGFPTSRSEEWKYTNITPFVKDEFTTLYEGNIEKISNEINIKTNIPLLECYHIYIVNGKYHPELSDKIEVSGLTVESISGSFDHPSFLKHFGQYADAANNHFVALNTALFADGLFIDVKDKTIVDKPLHVIHVSTADNNLFVQPRHLFVVGDQAQISIVESFVTTSESKTVFCNTVSEIVVGENSRVDHYYIQSGEENTRHIQYTQIQQKRSSYYSNYKASFPGIGLIRNNLNAVLDGEGIESHFYGIYLSGGNQLLDNHTSVDHSKPNCQSNELYKGIMMDKATGVFNGKIFVREDAQKTNAFQQNNNLMLSKDAVVDSKPQLEIYADDVKCSHGSTIGQFNEEALFYLKSRGIGEEKARALLILAFAFDVTEKIPSKEIRLRINQLIEAGLTS